MMLGAAAVSALPAMSETVLTIATVDNNDMRRMQDASKLFTMENPHITFNWVTLGENELRQKVTTDIATNSGQFDILTIGTYEAPIWADRGWLSPLDNLPESYDVDDLFPSVREGLSLDGTLYAAPFYGESSFTMYRTDLFEDAGLKMPAAPSWDFIIEAASTIQSQNSDVHGICLRGKPGWGENMAFITSMVNSYGGQWFDLEWQATLDSQAWSFAVADYVALLTDYGPPDAETLGYKENLALFAEGKCGIWVDATVAASTLTNPAISNVANAVGFAEAPNTGKGKSANWLWSWALAVPDSSEHKDAAKMFVAWATSKEYIALLAENDGWAQVPPGTRQSLYKNPAYLEAAPFGQLTKSSIESADPNNPTVNPVPYRGVQFVDVPEFPSVGTAVGTQISRAVAGELTVEKALENAQWVSGKAIDQGRILKQ